MYIQELYFFFINHGGGGGGYEKYFTLSTIVNVLYDMQINSILIAMVTKTKAKKATASKKLSLAAKKGWATRRKNAGKTTAAKKPRR